jgi:hypothetical protein
MRKALPDLTGKRAGLALAITLAALFAAGAAHLYFQDDIVSTPEAAGEAMAELTKKLFGGPRPAATGTLEPVTSPIPLTGVSDTKAFAREGVGLSVKRAAGHGLASQIRIES